MSAFDLVAATAAPLAPALCVQQWFNTDEDIELASLRGRVVVIHAFQMLCPGCVSHGIPQAQRIQQVFDRKHVAVIGLHTVFEHHLAMTPVSLKAFLHEYRVSFPVGVDAPSADGDVPQTMQSYGLRGTPSLVVLDRLGRIRLHAFGRPEDMAVGSAIATLVSEPQQASLDAANPLTEPALGRTDGDCTENGCALPTPEA